MIKKRNYLNELAKDNKIIKISSDHYYLNQLQIHREFTKLIYNENGTEVNKTEERFEQYLAFKYQYW
jgi:hypothetical protein